jgi:hypothetical protein
MGTNILLAMPALFALIFLRIRMDKKIILSNADKKGWASVIVGLNLANLFTIRRYKVRYIDVNGLPKSSSCRVTMWGDLVWNS